MAQKISGQLKNRIKKIKALVMDVDGILTNGKIVIDHQGHETKYFDVQDGFGIVLMRQAGYKTAIISARTAPAVTARAKDLKIDKVFQDAQPKTNAFQTLLKEFGLKPEEVCFMGDDVADICVLKEAGLAVSVPNGTNDTKRFAHYITEKRGGEGAVREVVELILTVKGQWKNIVKEFGCL